MDLDFYTITKEDLGKDSKIPLKVLGTEGEVFYEMAMDMINGILDNKEKGKNTVYICPVGPTGQYPIFVRIVNSMKLDLKDVIFISMDEYLDENKELIAIDNNLSFRKFMIEEVYNKISPELVMPEENRIFPEPGKEDHIWKKIEELGGVDICFGGVGINGHVAFNEPPEPGVEMSDEEFKNLSTRIQKISRETLAVNSIGALSGAIEALPKYSVTIGFKEIWSAKEIKLYCFRDWHRAVVRRAAYGESTCAFPVSLLQNHKNSSITLSGNVGEKAF